MAKLCCSTGIAEHPDLETEPKLKTLELPVSSDSKISHELLHPAGPIKSWVPLLFCIQGFLTRHSFQVTVFLPVTSQPCQDQQLSLNLSVQQNSI